MIPKKICMTSYTESLADPIIRNSHENLKSINPKWKLSIWEEDRRIDFIKNIYGTEILDTYMKINPIYGSARSDLFSFLYIYEIGGVYLDDKTFCKTPFDNFISDKDEIIFCQWSNQLGDYYEGWGLHPELYQISGGELMHSFFAAKPKNIFIKSIINYVINLINNYSPNTNRLGAYEILRTTGPVALTIGVFKKIVELRKSKTKFINPKIYKMNDIGLIFSVLDGPDKKPGVNQRIRKNHYTKIRAPLIINKSNLVFKEDITL